MGSVHAVESLRVEYIRGGKRKEGKIKKKLEEIWVEDNLTSFKRTLMEYSELYHFTILAIFVYHLYYLIFSFTLTYS